MITRIRKELWGQKTLFLAGYVMIFMAQFAMVFLQLGNYMCIPCIMDAFAWISYNMTSTIYIMVMLITIGLLKGIAQPETLLRQTRLRKVWIYGVIKVGTISFLMAIMNLLGTMMVGRMISSQWCNWESEDSAFFFVLGKITNEVDILLIIAVYFSSSFLGFFVSSMIPLLTYWLCNSVFSGLLISTLINAVGNLKKYNYDWKRGVFYNNIYYGIDIRYQFLFPILLIALMFLVGLMLKRKDFLPGKLRQEKEVSI